MSLETVNKIADLLSGEYLVIDRSPINTNYGKSYILSAIHVSSKKKYRFYANGLLVRYIDDESPPEFKIRVIRIDKEKNNKVFIDGYIPPPIKLNRNDELRKHLGLEEEMCSIEDAEDCSASDAAVLGTAAATN
jgi:hypothetical protein